MVQVVEQQDRIWQAEGSDLVAGCHGNGRGNERDAECPSSPLALIHFASGTAQSDIAVVIKL